jgi:hypothetical protein
VAAQRYAVGPRDEFPPARETSPPAARGTSPPRGPRDKFPGDLRDEFHV